MNKRAGFMEAKCFAASSPMPVLAPITKTFLPVRSALITGGTEPHLSWRKSKRVYLAMEILENTRLRLVKYLELAVKRLHYQAATNQPLINSAGRVSFLDMG